MDANICRLFDVVTIDRAAPVVFVAGYRTLGNISEDQERLGTKREESHNRTGSDSRIGARYFEKPAPEEGCRRRRISISFIAAPKSRGRSIRYFEAVP